MCIRSILNPRVIHVYHSLSTILIMYEEARYSSSEETNNLGENKVIYSSKKSIGLYALESIARNPNKHMLYLIC